MSTYTFKGQYGDYSFSTNQIEKNPHLDNEEKEIMCGLANWQSSKPSVKPKVKRRTIKRYPVDLNIDFKQKRWYESNTSYLLRKLEEAKRSITKPIISKEVKRTNIKIDKSTFEDGTELTFWDKDVKYFN